MRGQIKLLLKAIESDPLLKLTLGAHFGRDSETRMGLYEVTEGLRRLAEVVNSLQDEWSDGTAPLSDLSGPSMTPQELLFDGLAKAYCRGLNADPAEGLTKTYNRPGGPFVAFIRAAFTLEEKPQLEDPALYKALQRAGFIGTADKD